MTVKNMTSVPELAYCVQFSKRARSCRMWRQRQAWQDSDLGRRRDALGDHPGRLMTQHPPPGPPTCAAGENPASSVHASLMVRHHVLSCCNTYTAYCAQTCCEFLHLMKVAGNH